MNSLEILCVGNELLIGKTLNTNENWLARRATSLGFNVTRITTIGDELKVIEKAIKEAVNRKPKFIITTGGLGPTHDDMTLNGAAKALGQPLTLNEIALEMVRSKYDAYSRERGVNNIELTPARIKMATIPEGSKPLTNRVGTAPGVMIDLGEIILILLPGVPSEMKAIFDDSVMPLMKKKGGVETFYEASLFVDGVMESSLAPLIDQAMRLYPNVYIKSHPKGEERIPHVEVHFSTVASSSETAENRLKKAKETMDKLISNIR